MQEFPRHHYFSSNTTLKSLNRQPKHVHECVENQFKHFNLFGSGKCPIQWIIAVKPYA